MVKFMQILQTLNCMKLYKMYSVCFGVCVYSCKFVIMINYITTKNCNNHFNNMFWFILWGMSFKETVFLILLSISDIMFIALKKLNMC